MPVGPNLHCSHSRFSFRRIFLVIIIIFFIIGDMRRNKTMNTMKNRTVNLYSDKVEPDQTDTKY